ncbi:MAG: hypothetical protein AAF958_15720, partial [Planctomycetota bacterium]
MRYESTSGNGVSPTYNAGGSIAEDANFAAVRNEYSIFDDRGRLVHEVTPEGTLSYGYDASGRQASIAIGADLSAFLDETGSARPFVLEASGVRALLPSELAAADRITHFGYDLQGRLSEVREDADPDAATATVADVEADYDLQGRMRSLLTGTQVPMPSVLSVYEYDRLGRLDRLSEYAVDSG